MPTILGLDIGGANLKAALALSGEALSRPFALWKHPTGLGAALANLVAALPPADAVAVTMTGELCDCWPDKRTGVRAILDAVAAVTGDRPLHIWTTNGVFVDLVKAKQTPLEVASANWLATATYAGRFAPCGLTLFIDIGTTTTDIVPLIDGRVVSTARSDSERMLAGELVYRGWKRTPVCALGGLHLAAELFATMHDVFLVLGFVPPDPSDTDTADGRPATVEAARNRLARMYCLDPAECSAEEMETKAMSLSHQLLDQIVGEVNRVAARHTEPIAAFLTAGSGEFLRPFVTFQVSLQAEDISLAERWGQAGSTAAAAYAVAMLCHEQGVGP
jgi:(4-(4-[2-(gamma-L-glutamylamino)ethyl]phenoxymethyl)furan-2-yl)methanamine synthase